MSDMSQSYCIFFCTHRNSFCWQDTGQLVFFKCSNYVLDLQHFFLTYGTKRCIFFWGDVKKLTFYFCLAVVQSICYLLFKGPKAFYFFLRRECLKQFQVPKTKSMYEKMRTLCSHDFLYPIFSGIEACIFMWLKNITTKIHPKVSLIWLIFQTKAM